ncbi:MAG: hypothetical protein PHQ47_00560 [Candidatus Portnoybacteria bacterium]|nr:hypothetical protein [Candidatus Portnoybacteria bacterium]
MKRLIVLFLAFCLFQALSHPVNAQIKVRAAKDLSTIYLPSRDQQLPMKNGIATWSTRPGTIVSEVDTLFVNHKKLKEFEALDMNIIWPSGKTDAPLYFFVHTWRTGLAIPIILNETEPKSEWLQGEIIFD